MWTEPADSYHRGFGLVLKYNKQPYIRVFNTGHLNNLVVIPIK